MQAPFARPTPFLYNFSMSANSIQPIEQKLVVFYEDEIPAVVVEQDGEREVYVPIRPLCDYLGVSWPGQRERINRDPVLSEVGATVRVTRTEGDREVARELLCLPLDFLNGWLFGISALRVKEDVRERLITYQRECYRILARAFQRPSAETPAESSLLQVREMGLAIVRMAEEQIEFDRRLVTTEKRLDQAAVVVGDLNKRITDVEKRLSPGQPVTEEQASQISQAVKTVAITLGKQTSSNQFGAVYGELYRKFGITSYKQLPASKFEEAIAFLTEWHASLTGDEPF